MTEVPVRNGPCYRASIISSRQFSIYIGDGRPHMRVTQSNSRRGVQFGLPVSFAVRCSCPRQPEMVTYSGVVHVWSANRSNHNLSKSHISKPTPRRPKRANTARVRQDTETHVGVKGIEGPKSSFSGALVRVLGDLFNLWPEGRSVIQGPADFGHTPAFD